MGFTKGKKVWRVFWILFFIVGIGCKEGKEGASSGASQEESGYNMGIGPVKERLNLPQEIDKKMAKEGEKIFEMKCSMCHKLDERYVGPPLRGVTQRRTPEWIMNMILNPVEMTQKDPIAKKLLAEYLSQMPFQNVTQEDARKILEYFRYVDSQGGKKKEEKSL